MHKDEKFWDRIASKFDKIEANDIAYKIFIEKARGYLKADDTVLDFGCGTVQVKCFKTNFSVTSQTFSLVGTKTVQALQNESEQSLRLVETGKGTISYLILSMEVRIFIM